VSSAAEKPHEPWCNPLGPGFDFSPVRRILDVEKTANLCIAQQQADKRLGRLFRIYDPEPLPHALAFQIADQQGQGSGQRRTGINLGDGGLVEAAPALQSGFP